jgi:hypothetical protein
LDHARGVEILTNLAEDVAALGIERADSEGTLCPDSNAVDGS